MAPFVHFELRREPCIEAGERTQELDYRIVKIMCSLEGGYTSKGSEKKTLQRCVNLDA